jgi:hypothetical protein
MVEHPFLQHMDEVGIAKPTALYSHCNIFSAHSDRTGTHWMKPVFIFNDFMENSKTPFFVFHTVAQISVPMFACFPLKSILHNTS